MRVCQPGPVARHEAITSGRNRSDRSCFAFSSFGRPLRTSFSPRRRSASAIQDSVISGASSLFGEVRPEPFRFALMTMPHANDPSGRPSRRPNEHDEPRVQPADGNESGFPIVEPVIHPGEVESRKDLLRPAHVETPFPQRALPLLRVASYAHPLSVATEKTGVKATKVLARGLTLS